MPRERAKDLNLVARVRQAAAKQAKRGRGAEAEANRPAAEHAGRDRFYI